MSPATALSFGNGKASADAAPASLWARLEQVIQQDEEKSNLLKELMYRYDYLTQEYRRQCDEQAREREENASWKREKTSYEEAFRTMQIMVARNPFIVVLIDGDSMIFEDEYIRDGEQGGRRAAAQIHNAIANYLEREFDSHRISADSRIICRIYANVQGLAEVLVRTGVVPDVGIVEDFVHGFTQGKTLFDFIDVGLGKDRAHEKLIESFKLFGSDLHCRQIFFGCPHNNCYARLLENYVGDGTYLDKVTLLEGVPFEKELQNLPYKSKKLPGLFRGLKLQVFGNTGVTPRSANGINGGEHNSPQAANGINVEGTRSSPIAKTYNMIQGLPTRFPAPVRTSSETTLLDSPLQGKSALYLSRTPSSSSFASNDVSFSTKPVLNYAARAALPAPPVTESPGYKPANREEIIARNRAGQRVDPPCRDYNRTEVDRIKKIKMCNVHFLRGECPYGSGCTHLHNYKPTKDEISTLRLVARMAPCQNGSICADIKCIYGHRCPAPRADRVVKGTKSCIFGEQCKFPPELHHVDCNVVKTLVIR